jgi:hypothetical protein
LTLIIKTRSVHSLLLTFYSICFRSCNSFSLISLNRQNETTAQPAEEDSKVERTNDKSSSEKSTGRAIQSNYYFPLKQLLAKPVVSNNNQKTGRIIVYPSYTGVSANSIDNTRRVYSMLPPTGKLRTESPRQESFNLQGND